MYTSDLEPNSALEVVSKSQITSKDPAERDYISNLNRLLYASRQFKAHSLELMVKRISILQAISYELSANMYVSISKKLTMHLNAIKSMLNQALRDDAPLKI